MTEKAFMATVVSAARLLGWAVFHPYDSRRSEPGWPDLTLVRERVLFRELKVDGGRLSSSQRDWLDRLERAGQDVGVWHPADWSAIESELR